MEIKDKIVIITGASQGIGFVTAKYLSGKGAKIVLAARSADLINKLQKELPDSLAVVTDIRKHADIKNMVAQTIKKYGRVDIHINNAGQGMYGSVETINLEDYKQVMDLNVYGQLLAMQEVIPYMKKQGGGMIINVSSGVAKRYIPQIAAYSSTKYALNALSFIARQELKDDKIIVSVISPKITTTNFMTNAIGKRPSFGGNRPMPQVDTAEQVAEKIGELIKSEVEEIEM